MRSTGSEESSVAGTPAAAAEAQAAAARPAQPGRRDGSLIGYADPLIAPPRDWVRFKVSAAVESYEVVRVIQDARNLP